MKYNKVEYKIIGAFDTETTNIIEEKTAFPVLFQIGIFVGENLTKVTPENVEEQVNINLFRYSEEAINFLNSYYNKAIEDNCCYVFMVHNLSFDIYSIAELLNMYTSKVVARSTQTPITISLLDEEGIARLEFLDTLSLFGKSLGKLGKECKYDKLVGEWDYSLIRIPETDLTPQELEYSKRDIYVLFVYLAYWLKINPDIKLEWIGNKIVSKTGVVRQRRLIRFGNLECAENKRVKDYWNYQNKLNKPKTNEELLTMQASTRGGFTFCASEHAGKAFEGITIAGYDATSQHPAQMVSHYVPTDFKEVTSDILQEDFSLVTETSLETVLKYWVKPFDVAFYGAFKFTNLKPKENTVFSKNGIFSLADSRLKDIENCNDSESLYSFFENARRNAGYKDFAKNSKCLFGKIISAKECMLYLTELEAWILSRIYEYDSVEAISGYDTLRFGRPTDLSVLSVMNFYQNKNLFKTEMKHFDKKESVNKLDFVPDYLMKGMINHNESITNDMESFYFSLKSDLNALYGIEITNEARPDIVIDKTEGLSIYPFKGLEDMPKVPKTYYQFGQRIVGWSRVAQTVVMELINPYTQGIINGDTDSIKVIVDNEKEINKALEQYSKCLTHGKEIVTKRVKKIYPNLFDELKGIGSYEKEFETQKYYSGWNKAYLYCDNDSNYNITLAGIPQNIQSKELKDSVIDYANYLNVIGCSFSEICDNVIGYNIYYDFSLTKLNQRRLPEWNNQREYTITDYTGKMSKFIAPEVICLYPEIKVIGNTDNKRNNENYKKAKHNNPNISNEARLIAFDEELKIFRIERL